MATTLTGAVPAPEAFHRYARVTGVAMLLSIVFGFLGELYLPGKLIVSGDAAATAANFLRDPSLVRLTFAAYLVEGICDVLLCVLFYILLEPVNRSLSLIAAFFGIVSMVTFAVAESAFFSGLLLSKDAHGMAAFAVEQRNALTLLAMRLSATIGALFLIFYGIATMIRGYLIMRSGYIPKTIGILLIVGGAGFFLRTATYLLAPSLSSPVLLMPMALGGIPLTLWLLFKRLSDGGLRTAE
jgi:hypothetical protein